MKKMFLKWHDTKNDWFLFSAPFLDSTFVVGNLGMDEGWTPLPTHPIPRVTCFLRLQCCDNLTNWRNGVFLKKFLVLTQLVLSEFCSQYS